jgi:integrase
MSGYLKENKDKDGKTISFRIGAATGKDPVTGSYKYQFMTVKTDSKRVADKKLRELQSEIDKGVFVKPGKATLAEYLNSWLTDYCKPNLSPRTHELYSYMCQGHILPTLGNILLSDLKPQHLQHLYADKLQSGLSGRTVQLIHITLHKSLKNAVKTGLLVRNVAEAVDTPKVKRHEMHTMSEDDLQTFLKAAKSTPYHALFYTALFTGMRRSELLALRWSDIDLLLCQLSVTRSMQQLRNVAPENRITFKQPKTQKSRRMISLTPSNAIVLREHREAIEKQRASLNLPALADSDLVFSHYDGSPYLPNSITHAWIKLVRHCGLNGIRLHDARHTHASLLFKQGVHPKIVQERLGHAGIAITLDLYSHVAPGMQQAAAAKFDEIALPKESKLDKELNELTK